MAMTALAPAPRPPDDRGLPEHGTPMTRGRFTTLPCHIPGMWALVSDSGQSFARHTHEQFGIGVIRRGAQRSASGRGRVEAGAGDVITVNPGEVHDGAPITDDGRCWQMLYIDVSVMADAAEAMAGHENDYVFSRPVIRDRSVAARFLRLFAAATDAEATNALLHEELLLGLLAATRERHGSRRDTRSFPASLLRSRSRIDDDPAAPITLADLAEESGLSRYQMLRLFARATGLTPHAYLVQRRIDLARRLILSGRPLAEAALASGFADQSHMTRVFRRKYGLSPRSFAIALAKPRTAISF